MKRSMRAKLALAAVALAACVAGCSASGPGGRRNDEAAAGEARGTARSGAAVGVESSPEPGAAPQDTGGVCERICNNAKVLRCSAAAECVPVCELMRNAFVCTGEMEAFARCMAKQPPENWTCTPDGTAVLKDGFCEQEQANSARCAMAASASTDLP
jgi:hypothetical protein